MRQSWIALGIIVKFETDILVQPGESNTCLQLVDGPYLDQGKVGIVNTLEFERKIGKKFFLNIITHTWLFYL